MPSHIDAYLLHKILNGAEGLGLREAVPYMTVGEALDAYAMLISWGLE